MISRQALDIVVTGLVPAILRRAQHELFGITGTRRFAAAR
jgi:hypothetical protein